jgi:electron-transferring-flavoprotein dehydrogenase
MYVCIRERTEPQHQQHNHLFNLVTLEMFRAVHLNQVRLSGRRFLSAAVEREKIFFDVVTVGAGPAGLAGAIRLKQLAVEKGVDLSVCVIEKGAEVGSHILSGNVFEPRALDELFPEWRNMDAPIHTPAGDDKFMWLSEKGHIDVPFGLMPSQLHNHGNYIISLSQLTRWLAQRAEELGVEIYPGFAASEVLYKENGAVSGVSTATFSLMLCLCLQDPRIH